MRRLLGDAGQFAHTCVGDHRKPTAVLAGARRFDGGIQGQQIGLIGNLVDRLRIWRMLAVLSLS